MSLNDRSEEYLFYNVKIPISNIFSLTLPSIMLKLEYDEQSDGPLAFYEIGKNSIQINEALFGTISWTTDSDGNRIMDLKKYATIDLENLETTLYHEGIHLFEDQITKYNLKATSVHLELDKLSYFEFEAPFKKAAKKIWEKYYVLIHSIRNIPEAIGTHANKTWIEIRGEAIARIEAKIYSQLRMDKGFTQANLEAWRQDWLYNPTYWAFPVGEKEKVRKFLQSEAIKRQIREEILPIIHDIQKEFILLRQKSIASDS